MFSVTVYLTLTSVTLVIFLSSDNTTQMNASRSIKIPRRMPPTLLYKKDKMKGSGSFLSYAIPAVLAGGASVLAVPAVLGFVGFTSAGIAAGSLAAKMMSISAIANGGGVAAGGMVATLQSVGAAGLGAAGTAATAGVGAAVGAGGRHVSKTFRK